PPPRAHRPKMRWGGEAPGGTRLVVRQKRLARFDRAKHFFLRFADTDSTNCVAVEIKIDNRLRTLLAQLAKRRALNDSENKLARCSCWSGTDWRCLGGSGWRTAAGDRAR